MKKYILIFVPNAKGGAELITMLIFQLIDHKRFRVKLVIVGEKQTSERVESLNHLSLNVKKYKFSLFQFYNLLRKEKPDYIFTSLLGIAIPVLIVSFFIRTYKTVLRQSFMPDRFSKYSLTNWGIRILYPKAYRIIAQTEEMKSQMIKSYKLKEEKIRVVNNPLDSALIDQSIKRVNPYIGVEGPKYVTVGNVRFIKGHDILVEAFKKVKDRYPSAQLFVIGKYKQSDPYYLQISSWIEKESLSTNIHFLGFIENPYAYIHYADCFVLPSRSEGLPNALLEAMYLNKPLVAANCIPFIDKNIIDDMNGYKVEVGNANQLAAAMIKAINLDVTGECKYRPSTQEEITSIFE